MSLRASGGPVGLPDAVSWGKVLGVWELRGDFVIFVHDMYLETYQ